MSRPTKKITLPVSKQEVEIVTSLTWGEKEDLEAIIQSGTKVEGHLSSIEASGFNFDSSVLQAAKYKLIEIAVKSIVNGEEKIKYSVDWVRGLDIKDGDALYAAIDDLSKKK